jgi:protein gp37
VSTKTSIEWTKNDDGSAGRTWNVVTGCDKISPGCDHCYAESIARRFAGGPGFPNGFAVTVHPERLTAPLRWRTPTRVFVNSMSDMFHADIPDDLIAQMFAVMAATPQHTYQILTKRHGRMRSLLKSGAFGDLVTREVLRLDKSRVSSAVQAQLAEHFMALRAHGEPMLPLPNVHLGVSVEDQKWADIRIPALLDTPAAVRFISAEPLLGPIDLAGPLVDGCHRPRLNYWLTGRPGWGPEEVGPTGVVMQGLVVDPKLDWVIVGAESGPGARPMNLDWVRLMRDECAEQGVAFFFKQAAINGKKIPTPELDGKVWVEMPRVPEAVSAP